MNVLQQTFNNQRRSRKAKRVGTNLLIVINMKKLISSFILAIGVIVAVQAQSLVVNVINGSVHDWSVRVNYQGGTITLNAPSNGGPVTSGVISLNPNTSPLPIAVDAAIDNSNCSTSTVISGAGTGNFPPMNCQLRGEVKYNLTITGGNYVLDIVIG
jgi:hypothetical protein